MRILFLTMSGWSYPSSRLRVFKYLPYLKGKYEYEVIPFGSEWAFRKGVHFAYEQRAMLVEKAIHRAKSEVLRKINSLHSMFCEIQFLLKRSHYDLVFVQKVHLPKWIVDRIKDHWHARLIFDFDDAIFLKQGRRSTRYFERYNYLMQRADAVITTSKFNKDYAQRFNKNVHILLTPVDTARHMPKNQSKQDGKVVIGWVGTPSTTRHLKAFLPVIEEIDRNHDVAFRFIGAIPFESGLRNVRFLPWEYDTEVKYMQEFDIGIMPLIKEDTVLGKAGYKLIQYMAMGIPSVASPWGINEQIVDIGKTGFLAKSNNDWLKCLRSLILNAYLREKMGKNARQIAVNKYSFEAFAPKFLYVLNSIKSTPFDKFNKCVY